MELKCKHGVSIQGNGECSSCQDIIDDGVELMLGALRKTGVPDVAFMSVLLALVVEAFQEQGTPLEDVQAVVAEIYEDAKTDSDTDPTLN